MSDDITLGEIGRIVQDIRRDIITRAEFEGYRLLQEQRLKEQADDIAELKQRLSVAETRKWQVWLAIFSGILAPIIIIFVQARNGP